jgi:hypothetical protein
LTVLLGKKKLIHLDGQLKTDPRIPIMYVESIFRRKMTIEMIDEYGIVLQG